MKLKFFTQFNVTLSTNHNIYYREENDVFSQSLGHVKSIKFGVFMIRS
jgi:hypothetical protein